MAEKSSVDKIGNMLRSGDAPARLAAALAAGFRLTLPGATAEIADDLPLARWRSPGAYAIEFVDGKVNLNDFGRVGTYTVAEHWNAGKHTREQEQLFALLAARLADEDEKVRLQAAHFLYLLNDSRTEPVIARVRTDVERVRLNEGRTIQIPARPDLNYTTITETRVWDTVFRVDHQISANTSWGARWITEWSPQRNQTNNAAVTLTAAQQEWDRDDTGSIHVNSVLGTNRVNTLRLSMTREDDRFAPNGFPACEQNSPFWAVWSANFNDCIATNQTAMKTQ